MAKRKQDAEPFMTLGRVASNATAGVIFGFCAGVAYFVGLYGSAVLTLHR